MRYTTVIDISEQSAVYKNVNCRLVYLHLVLKSGYHDTDRDMIDISLRNLAWQVGITVSATRHALAILQRYQLLTRQGNMWIVKKWTVQDTITARPKSQKQQRLQDDEEARRKQREREERKEAAARQEREQLRASGKTPFMVWYEQQQQLADQGDADAQRAVARHRETYEAHKAELTKESKK